jgi:hypothetical protein
MTILKILLVSIFLILINGSYLVAQNTAVNNMTFERKMEWLAKTIKKTGNFTFHSRFSASESKISQIKFDGCKVMIERTSVEYPKAVITKAHNLPSTGSSDFKEDETYQVDALKHRSITTTSFSLTDLNPEQIKIDWSPDKKLVGKNNKLVALILLTHNEDKIIEYVDGKIPMFSSRTQFFVNRESAGQISQVFADVIKKCQ